MGLSGSSGLVYSPAMPSRGTSGGPQAGTEHKVLGAEASSAPQTTAEARVTRDKRPPGNMQEFPGFGADFRAPTLAIAELYSILSLTAESAIQKQAPIVPGSCPDRETECSAMQFHPRIAQLSRVLLGSGFPHLSKSAKI